MKKALVMLISLCMLLVTACGNKVTSELRFPVTILDTDVVSAENNGLLVYPGHNARFTLNVKAGYAVTGTDYAGKARIWSENGKLLLELEKVDYPVHVTVTAVSMYRTIEYDANGGEVLENRSTTKTYSVSTHTRPNTDNGKNMLKRDGYTLTGWNTAADGTGEAVGLGSRVTVPESGLKLYAVWKEQTDAGFFRYEKEDGGITITGYGDTPFYTDLSSSSYAGFYPAEPVIPETIEGLPVTKIASGAFEGSGILSVTLPNTLKTVESGAFANSALKTVTLFDNIETISDDAFEGCKDLKTLYINAFEAPYGYLYRRESVYADKVDMLINAKGSKKLVFYGGCSMWYNLQSVPVHFNFDKDYIPVNMGLNGTINGHIQMQIIEAFLEDGDVLVHAPEISGEKQLLTDPSLGNNDSSLWCGLENNYDLFSLVDLRTVTGVFNSLCTYLSKKDKEASYDMTYRDSDNRLYMDDIGSIPFAREREEHADTDRVDLDPEGLTNSDLSDLLAQYDRYSEKGVKVIVSYACVNIDAVPEDHRENITATDLAFREKLDGTGYPVISNLWDYIFHDEDFSDTNYHLTSAAAERYTATFIRDLHFCLDGAVFNGMPEESGVKQ